MKNSHSHSHSKAATSSTSTKPQALSSPKQIPVMASPPIPTKPQALSSSKQIPVMAPPPIPTKPQALSSPKQNPFMAPTPTSTKPQALSSLQQIPVMAPPPIPKKPQALSSPNETPVMAPPPTFAKPQALSSPKRIPAMAPRPLPTKPQALSSAKKPGMAQRLDLNLPPPVVAPERGSSSSSSSQKVNMDNYQSCSVRHLLHNHMNFKNSEIPTRFMYYSNDSWVDFKEEEVLGAVKDGFAKKRPVIDVDIDGVCYIFDFMRMLQIDTKGGIQRSVAWIDEEGKCFFPKLFVSEEDVGGEEEEDDEEEEEVAGKIKADGNKLKRKFEDFIEVDSFGEGKSTAVPVAGVASSGGSKWLGAVLLKETDNGLSIVRNHLLSGLGKKDVKVDFLSVHQCARNTPLGQARWQLFQKQMEITEKTRGKANTVHAWYGGSAADIARVLVHGFRAVDAGHNCIPYGLGVHLSPIGMPYMSDLLAKPDENGEKHMLLCRVVLGNVEKVKPGSMQSRPCSVQFDSGADDPQDPQWFVVWHMNMSSHILPECVVTYKPVHTGLKVSVSEQLSLVALVANIKNEIPLSKIPQLDALYEKVRENKMDRIAFLAHVRSLVGVHILKAAAQHAHIKK